jgi:hypothetical protein
MERPACFRRRHHHPQRQQHKVQFGNENASTVTLLVNTTQSTATTKTATDANNATQASNAGYITNEMLNSNANASKITIMY